MYPSIRPQLSSESTYAAKLLEPWHVPAKLCWTWAYAHGLRPLTYRTGCTSQGITYARFHTHQKPLKVTCSTPDMLSVNSRAVMVEPRAPVLRHTSEFSRLRSGISRVDACVRPFSSTTRSRNHTQSEPYTKQNADREPASSLNSTASTSSLFTDLASGHHQTIQNLEH